VIDMGGAEILHTKRLLLRRLQSASEISALVDLWTDPDVTRYMGGPRHRDQLEANLRQTLASPERPVYDLWPLLERDNLRLVGHCGLVRKDVDGRNEVELTYVVAQSEWGFGYATEIAAALAQHAFKQLGETRLIALIDPQNSASLRVAEKIGMRFERDVVRPGGAVRRMYASESPQSQQTEAMNRLKYGAAAWNRWRRTNPDAVIVLDKADLSGLILTGIDFSGVSLRGARLHATNLMNADLRGADLTDANLTEADLIAANLDGAVLIGANLHETDLLGTDLSRVRYRAQDLEGALHVTRVG
jgi:ribosomal-protein-alanine N-acetyltransferase